MRALLLGSLGLLFVAFTGHAQNVSNRYYDLRVREVPPASDHMQNVQRLDERYRGANAKISFSPGHLLFIEFGHPFSGKFEGAIRIQIADGHATLRYIHQQAKGLISSVGPVPLTRESAHGAIHFHYNSDAPIGLRHLQISYHPGPDGPSHLIRVDYTFNQQIGLADNPRIITVHTTGYVY